MDIGICNYIHINIDIYINIYMYTYTYIYLSIPLHIHLYMYPHEHLDPQFFVFSLIQKCTQATQEEMHMCKCKHVVVCAHSGVWNHTNITRRHGPALRRRTLGGKPCGQLHSNT